MISREILNSNKYQNMEFTSVLLWLFFGWACYKLAEKQGRNEILGAVLGVVFGVFAVIGYWIAGDKNPTPPTAPTI